jgi:hypothetical protein
MLGLISWAHDEVSKLAFTAPFTGVREDIVIPRSTLFQHNNWICPWNLTEIFRTSDQLVQGAER